jgi:hypothetical protein
MCVSPYSTIIVLSSSSLQQDLATAIVLTMFTCLYAIQLLADVTQGIAGTVDPSTVREMLELARSFLTELGPLEDYIRNFIMTNMMNVRPEEMRELMAPLQSVIELHEMAWQRLSPFITMLEREDVTEVVFSQFDELFEDLRNRGNDLVETLRELETRLDLPSNQRLSPYWFEDED